jgi:hypothetical protein
MDAYNIPTSTAASALMVYGRSLTHRHKSEAERIAAAVAILEGRLNIYAPCLSQVARMLNVSAGKVRAALPQHGKQKRHDLAESLTDHLARSSPAERAEAARVLGADVVWDTMIVPLIAEDRKATVATE